MFSSTLSRFEGVVEWFESLELFKKYSDLRDSRKVLFSVNLIIAICSLCLSGFSAYLSVILYDPAFSSGWINWLGLSIVGLALAVTCIVGMRGAHLVSLDLLLTYFWGITVFVAPLLLGIVACIDFYSYMSVWFEHEWEEQNFQGVRELFCPPEQPNLAKCAAPLFNAGDWCMKNFNSTDCQSIRETAIATSLVWGREITLGQAIISIIDLVLIGFSLFFCYRLLKRNVIAQSMNDVINYLLVLPIGGSCGIAYYLWWLQAYSPERLQYSWLAGLFAALAVTQVCALPLGIAAGRLKSQFLLTVYMLLIFMITTGLALGGTIALLFAGLISETFQPSAAEIGDIACRKQLNGCSNCEAVQGASVNRCPQWAKDEVISLLVLDLKIAGIVAFVSLLYLFGAMIVAFLVQQSLENYKNDYIGMGRPKGAEGQSPTSSSLTQSLSATVGTASTLVAGMAGDFAGGVSTVGGAVVEGVGMVSGRLGGAVYETVGGAGGAVAGVLRGDRPSWGARERLAGGDEEEGKKKSRQVQWAEGDGDGDSGPAAGGSASGVSVFTTFTNFSGKTEPPKPAPVPVLPPLLTAQQIHRHKDHDRLAIEAARELEEWISDIAKPYIVASESAATPPLFHVQTSHPSPHLAAAQANAHGAGAGSITPFTSATMDGTMSSWPSPNAGQSSSFPIPDLLPFFNTPSSIPTINPCPSVSLYHSPSI